MDADKISVFSSLDAQPTPIGDPFVFLQIGDSTSDTVITRCLSHVDAMRLSYELRDIVTQNRKKQP